MRPWLRRSAVLHDPDRGCSPRAADCTGRRTAGMTRDFDGTSETDQKQCADKNLGTKFRQRGNPLYLAILLPVVTVRFLARLSESALSLHTGFLCCSGVSPVGPKQSQTRVVVDSH